jgi:hypothetical protein
MASFILWSSDQHRRKPNTIGSGDRLRARRAAPNDTDLWSRSFWLLPEGLPWNGFSETFERCRKEPQGPHSRHRTGLSGKPEDGWIEPGHDGKVNLAFASECQFRPLAI